MENKEIEKLVGETVQNIIDDGTIDHDTIRTALTLADKQGYMRGVEDSLRMLPKERDVKGDPSNAFYGTVAAVSAARHFNDAIYQAHDAISKLKEKI